jgi:hypothetical protein
LAAFAAVALGSILAVGFLAKAEASSKANGPSGTWTWDLTNTQGRPAVEYQMKLEVDGDKVTGKVTHHDHKSGKDVEEAVQNGKLNGDEISFATIREVKGAKVGGKFKGKIQGDSIKGEVIYERDGVQFAKSEWSPKRTR